MNGCPRASAPRAQDMFLRDHWYVGAWSDEVGLTPLARTLLGEPIVLFRKGDGRIVALEDRCAHRRLPLSMGRVIGDTIQCGYHGLVYDGTGTCIGIPGQQGIPASARVRSYPVVERNQFVSLWMGDPELADGTAAISFPRLADPGGAFSKVRLAVAANYLLIVDNLLDLSHVAYVHNSTIGNAPVAESATVKTTAAGGKVRITREMVNVPAARTYAEFGPYQGSFDRWQLSEYTPPGYFLINNGCAAANSGIGEDRRLAGPGEWGFQVYHCITPQDERRTHQFWAIAYDKTTVAAEQRAKFNRQHHHVIGEDVAIYEAQQRALDGDREGASAQDVRSAAVIRADAGLIHARRIINQLRAAPSSAERRKRVAPAWEETDVLA
jgi:phenylpropionate dioxygenase-like ring-hydroxylating dioxygenase large terminal subunit